MDSAFCPAASSISTSTAAPGFSAMEDAGENEGFGISEDTALEVSLSDGALRVHGSAYVMHLTRSGGTITINKLTAAQHAVQ